MKLRCMRGLMPSCVDVKNQVFPKPDPRRHRALVDPDTAELGRGCLHMRVYAAGGEVRTAVERAKELYLQDSVAGGMDRVCFAKSQMKRSKATAALAAQAGLYLYWTKNPHLEVVVDDSVAHALPEGRKLRTRACGRCGTAPSVSAARTW